MDQEYNPLIILSTSTAIKEKRYDEEFFTIIFSLFPTFDAVAGIFNLSVTQLLQLLLENLYDGDKIDKYVSEIKMFEDKGTSESIRHSLIEPIVRQYLNVQNESQDIQKKVLDFVDLSAKMDMIIALLYNPIWEQDIFYIENQSRVKFYSQKHIKNKLERLLTESDINPFTMKNELFREFLFHKFDITSIHCRKQKKEIERLLTQFYQVYSKRKPL